jgi:putative transposase
MDDIFVKASHNPPHLFVSDAMYMLTASIYQQKDLMQADHRKDQWKNAFFTAAEICHWQVIAWVVMNNHYHAMVQSPPNPLSLSTFINSYHKFTAHQWNEEDRTPGRRVWHNFWDTCIRSEKDYLSRLNYIFWNPIKHGMALHPEEYPYCNYIEFAEALSGDIEEVDDVPEA